MPIIQENRLISIDTPLGKDLLLLREFSGQEGMSQLFQFQLDLLSEDHAIKFEDIIGKPVTVRLMVNESEERFFHGYINRFVQTDSGDELANYQATLVPWLWFLTRTADCRIFQEMTIPDIILKIFSDLGFQDVKNTLTGTYEPWEYCVQYRETDFNFVSRLMEQYGIFYFFEHEEQKHTLVLADAITAHQPVPLQEKARWHPQGMGKVEDSVVTSLQFEKEFRPGKCCMTDYNFKTPTTSLLSEVDTTTTVGDNKNYEIYDYPGEYENKAEGEKFVKIRMEEEEAQYLIITGTSNCRAFTSGYRFELEEYGRADMNQAYVLTDVQHTGSLGDAYTSDGGGEGDQDYSNSITCLPHSVPFRPPRVTPKPVVQGPQTAMVVGPSGEEIWVDKYGRVKVQFYWDREGKKDQNSSCWIRVSQVHAGKGFGGIDTPRIGDEVIVGFLEGDPDQPIIVGRVYNAQNMPPNGLPGAGMISGLKSNSTPGGGGNNCIMMDDTKGNEMYSMNAQFNCNENVGNDRTSAVGVNETLTVGTDRSATVGSNETINIGADQTVDIGANQTETIGANCSQTVSSSKTETISVAKALSIGAAYQVSVGAVMNESVGGAKLEEIGGAKVVGVGGLSSENVGASKSTNAGSNISENAGGNISETAGGSLSEKAGGDISSTAGGKMSLTATGDFSAKTSAKGSVDAASELLLKCGGASIILKSGGEIAIKGTDITINGSKIGVKGSGPVTIKGSKVDINS